MATSQQVYAGLAGLLAYRLRVLNGSNARMYKLASSDGRPVTVMVRPGEHVRIRVRFDRHPGLFLYHCHILEHEDQGMMRNFLVEA